MRTFSMSLALAVLALAASAAHGAPLAGHEHLAVAKIGLEQARAIALAARPGKITDQELEKEKGGSGLRYSFDVTAAARTYEVGVDAVTGKVLENGKEGANPD